VVTIIDPLPITIIDRSRGLHMAEETPIRPMIADHGHLSERRFGRSDRRIGWGGYDVKGMRAKVHGCLSDPPIGSIFSSGICLSARPWHWQSIPTTSPQTGLDYVRTSRTGKRLALHCVSFRPLAAYRHPYVVECPSTGYSE
jgi:hypothetical protein